MLKNILKIEVNINEKIYTFLCDHDSPMKDTKEASFQIQKCLGQIEDKINEQLQALQDEQESKISPNVKDSKEISKQE